MVQSGFCTGSIKLIQEKQNHALASELLSLPSLNWVLFPFKFRTDKLCFGPKLLAHSAELLHILPVISRHQALRDAGMGSHYSRSDETLLYSFLAFRRNIWYAKIRPLQSPV